jgi:hypothetical protein
MSQLAAGRSPFSPPLPRQSPLPLTAVVTLLSHLRNLIGHWPSSDSRAAIYARPLALPSTHFSPNSLATRLSTTMVRPPSLDSNITTIIHSSARDLIQYIGAQLEARARESNIIYPHALDLKSKEEKGEAVPPNQLWITCWTKNSRGHSLDFVLSCTSHLLGDYPIFIYCHHPASSLTDAFVRPRIHALARALSGQVPPTRVFLCLRLEVHHRRLCPENGQR